MPLLASGHFTRDEVDRFLRGLVIAAFAVCLPLGIIAWYAKYPKPACAGVLDFSDTPKVATSIVYLAGDALLLYWVWFRGGDAVLARFGPALGGSRAPHPWSPRLVRLAVSALMVVSLGPAAIMYRTMPTESVCVEPSTAA